MIGRRLPNLEFDKFPKNIKLGDYWKILNAGDSKPRKSTNPQNLTGTCWFVIPPKSTDGKKGYAIGRLENHTVREHDDDTISVRPGDGSSNSILITKSSGYSWHGYIEHGVWKEC